MLTLSANPDFDGKEVKEILQNTTKIGAPADYINGHSLKYGYGRVNADRAVAVGIAPKKKPSNQFLRGAGCCQFRGKDYFVFDVQKQAPEGWGVQIGVFYDYGNVLIQAERMKSLFDQPAIVHISELQGKTAYRWRLAH